MRLCYHCMTQITEEQQTTCPNCGKSLEMEPVDGRYLQPGTVLQGKFVIGYPIGTGGFGNTYIGWNQVLLRKVAIKEFYPEQYIMRGDDGVTITVEDHTLMPRFQKGLRQFLEEARSVAMLQDIKGVVEISSFFEENGTGYIVMEYLEGMDVKTILKKSGSKRDYEWSRRVVLTVLHTLRDIHNRGVLHRDIAPDNIFVTNDGVIKLIDFGAAKHATQLANAKADVMLKVGYAPIEQYSKTAAQGPYTDLYAVAALFYRMLTGQKPIPANERLKKDSLIPPSEMGIELPEQAELAIMVCLNVKPEYRLQSADEFMEALEGQDFVPVYEPEWILGDIAKEDGFFYRIARLPVIAKAGLGILGLGLIGGLVLGGVALSRGRSADVGLGRNVIAGNIEMKQYKKVQTLENARKDLEDQGFTNIKEEYVLSDSEAGTIIDQSIDPGQMVAAESEMIFTVSGGSGEGAYYTVPSFTGKKEKEIKNWFVENDFEVQVVKNPADTQTPPEVFAPKNPNNKQTGKILIRYDFNPTDPKGACSSQTEEGEKIEANKDITFNISLGAKEKYDVSMPDLRGKKKEEVKSILKKKKIWELFDEDIVFKEDPEAYSDTVSKGDVLEQTPVKGTVFNRLNDVNKNIQLVLVLSAGEKPIPTPEPVVPERNNDTWNSNQNNRDTSQNKPKRTKKPQTRKSKDSSNNDVVDWDSSSSKKNSSKKSSSKKSDSDVVNWDNSSSKKNSSSSSKKSSSKKSSSSSAKKSSSDNSKKSDSDVVNWDSSSSKKNSSSSKKKSSSSSSKKSSSSSSKKSSSSSSKKSSSSSSKKKSSKNKSDSDVISW